MARSTGSISVCFRPRRLRAAPGAAAQMPSPRRLTLLQLQLQLLLTHTTCFSPREAGSCSYAVDCNTRVCPDCSCVSGICQCADGFSGPHCEVPFCNATAGCSEHGACHQTATSMSCVCDAGWAGPHCASAACGVTCEHGGTCEPGATSAQAASAAGMGRLAPRGTRLPGAQTGRTARVLKNRTALRCSLTLRSIRSASRARCVGWASTSRRVACRRKPARARLHPRHTALRGAGPAGSPWPSGARVGPARRGFRAVRRLGVWSGCGRRSAAGRIRARARQRAR